MQSWQSIFKEHIQKSAKPVIVVLGPTASGKTDFSIRLTQETPITHNLSPITYEIINADSRQLYRHLNIGTAKITDEKRQRIIHHLFDVLDPKEEVTVAWYRKKAVQTIDDILARGNIPILVGGSMLYISAVTDGYVFSGRGKKITKPIPYDLLVFGLHWPREELVKRIHERTAKLLRFPSHVRVPPPKGEGTKGRGSLSAYNGSDTKSWIQEVESILQRGYTPSDPGMKSYGYREIAEWILKGKDSKTFPALEEEINKKTRQYAKRQMTWWRKNKRIYWIPGWTARN
ncbi:hypothetical protein A3D11_00035 [Candidatus Peribacteria bacterium RIFCSPHIGHO2_02_FULL_49_16]|nr:MAG: hypothetical protein A2880_00400 [Candidatus Peribacteria bacterium RIFCSPHIGHO2_01_FULL_49_38]OGJ59444.1 MAG: hypothetical protein A3D11_00035 [Candidatus Peribacteria bacterium RIFCSPHIGHO2_02_FULL_49_16]